MKEGFLIGGGLLFTGMLLQVAAGANHVIDDLSQLPALVCVVN